MSNEGRKDDGRGDLTLAAKLRYDLIPVMPLADLAEVYTVGAAKYKANETYTELELIEWLKGFAKNVVRVKIYRPLVCADLAMNETLNEETLNMLNAKKNNPENGEMHTQNIVQQFQNVEMLTQNVVPEINKPNIRAASKKWAYQWKPTKCSKYDKETNAEYVELLWKQSNAFVLTMTILQDSQEVFYATSATSLLECLEIMYAALPKHLITLKSLPIKAEWKQGLFHLEFTGDRNWEQGIKYSRILAAMFRHLESFRAGEDKDKESGCYHLASVAWGAFALLEYTRTHPDLDDRILFETRIGREEQLNRELAEAARELRIAMVHQMAEQLMEELRES